MLIHPWDAATAEEWRALLGANPFGQLIAAGRRRDYPVVVPTHFSIDGDQVLLHLARPNPVWEAIEESPYVVLSVVADWAYVEAEWNANPGTDPDYGVPTSYYSAVQLRSTATVIDDPAEKAALLARQLADFEPPDTNRVTPSLEVESDRRLLPGIRGLRLTVHEVAAKQKYGGNKTHDHQLKLAEHLARRAAPGDAAARGHLLRRSGG